MIPFTIEHRDEVTSTNSVLLDRARQGAPEGLVLTARFQTTGRGKPGRVWVSSPGKDLLCSILLRPPLTPARAPILTQTACRAVATVLKAKYDIGSKFKRPNDVMIGDRKICGTLVEALSTVSKLEAVVIGIGLNVNSQTKDLPLEGVSMRMVKGAIFPVREVLSNILRELEAQCADIYKK